MSEITMPTAEAMVTDAYDERNRYEFAFHVLPTVVEGEVAGVFDSIKAHITQLGGEIVGEEMPERIELAYPIVKSIEGKNRKFTSSYFGWVRFALQASEIDALKEVLEAETTILRDLLIKLSRVEEENPFRYHEHRKSLKMVEVIDEEALSLGEVKTEDEESVVVSEAALDESLEKITTEETVA